MGNLEPLTNGEVQRLVYAWFRGITDKVGLDELLTMLSSTDLEMCFPEVTIRDREGFQRWYEDVTGIFFDQVHDVKLLAIDPNGSQAQVSLIVNWRARKWEPPAARSDWQSVNVQQNWTVKRAADDGRPVIAGYYVGSFDPVQG